MKEKIYKLFSSSIKINIKGKNINNFIKRVIKSKINIFKIENISYREANIIIDYNDLDKLKRLKSIYDIKIVKYYGKLRALKIIKKNRYIFIFLILGIITIYILSNMIFSIRVIHSNGQIISLVEKELYNNGIKKYTFAKSYKEIEKIKKKILEDNKEHLEWLEIIREGTLYTVRVEERVINDKKDDNKIYDIVSSKNAIIKKIYAYSGEKVKNVDTYIKKGDTIISSKITLPNNSFQIDSASGKVLGEVWYQVDIEFPYHYEEVKYTSKSKKVLVYTILNKRISFFDFHKFKTFNKDTKYIFKNNIIPINLAIEYQYETNVINKNYSYDEAKEMAILKAKEKLKLKYKMIDNINKVVITNEDDLQNKIKLSLFITAIEDITEKKEKEDISNLN